METNEGGGFPMKTGILLKRLPESDKLLTRIGWPGGIYEVNLSEFELDSDEVTDWCEENLTDAKLVHQPEKVKRLSKWASVRMNDARWILKCKTLDAAAAFKMRWIG